MLIERLRALHLSAFVSLFGAVWQGRRASNRGYSVPNGRQLWSSKHARGDVSLKKSLISLVGGAGFEPATPGL